MEWYLEVAQLYEEFNSRISVRAFVQLFKDGITV